MCEKTGQAVTAGSLYCCGAGVGVEREGAKDLLDAAVLYGSFISTGAGFTGLLRRARMRARIFESIGLQ